MVHSWATTGSIMWWVCTDKSMLTWTIEDLWTDVSYILGFGRACCDILTMCPHARRPFLVCDVWRDIHHPYRTRHWFWDSKKGFPEDYSRRRPELMCLKHSETTDSSLICQFPYILYPLLHLPVTVPQVGELLNAESGTGITVYCIWFSIFGLDTVCARFWLCLHALDLVDPCMYRSYMGTR